MFIMKKFRVTRILSGALALVTAVTVFTSSAFAGNVRTDQYKRELTAEEKQLISTVFDAKYYANAYLDVLHFYGYDYYKPEADAVLLNHFLDYGIWEERQPNAGFAIDVYATRNGDLRQKYGDDIIAYYVHYASEPKEAAWRVIPTWNDAYAKGATIYSVYDLVAGSTTAIKAGAVPVQTPNYAPNLGIGVTNN